MQQEDPDLVAVGAADDLLGIARLIDRHAHVPVEPERMDAEDVLGLAQRQAWPRQHGFGTRERLVARDAVRRLPGAELGGDGHGRFLSCSFRCFFVGTAYIAVVPAQAGTHNP